MAVAHDVLLRLIKKAAYQYAEVAVQVALGCCCGTGAGALEVLAVGSSSCLRMTSMYQMMASVCVAASKTFCGAKKLLKCGGVRRR